MSTFDGEIKELKGVSVDNFTWSPFNNYDSSIYFLSHCHSDHMNGLNNNFFQDLLLQRNEVYVYSSAVSVQILKSLHPKISERFKSLPIDSPTLLKLPESESSFTVTLIPAGHCPGSVMFLFEIENQILLYTGDFRINPTDLKKIKAFYSLNQQKRINKIYLDTTFFLKSYATFPSRDESLEALCKLIKEWLNKHAENVVHILIPARYGSEYLFMGIYDKLRIPIHVSNEAFNVYKHIPEMDKVVTTNSDGRLHSTCGSNFRGMCKHFSNVRIIKPCALSWKGNDYKEGIVNLKDGMYRVCYSCHGSYQEITKFLEFLKPDEIVPCVLPSKKNELEEMLKSIDDVINQYKNNSSQTEAVKLFKARVCDKIAGERSNSQISTVLEDEGNKAQNRDVLNDNILASPPKVFKRRRL